MSTPVGHSCLQALQETHSFIVSALPISHLAGHYHDTKARALDNVKVSLDHGLRVFDAAVAGLGGCPYAPGAKGNVATEAVNELLLSLGFAKV